MNTSPHTTKPIITPLPPRVSETLRAHLESGHPCRQVHQAPGNDIVSRNLLARTVNVNGYRIRYRVHVLNPARTNDPARMSQAGVYCLVTG